MGQNVHLFFISTPQLVIFVFLLVLAGTTLTALIAYYIFPYDWSFNLAMIFGSILSASDPVMVAALLEQVGAPPHLKVHIAGESLLNDGAAIVFFAIFSTELLRWEEDGQMKVMTMTQVHLQQNNRKQSMIFMKDTHVSGKQSKRPSHWMMKNINPLTTYCRYTNRRLVATITTR